jgi:hypothetical protein
MRKSALSRGTRVIPLWRSEDGGVGGERGVGMRMFTPLFCCPWRTVAGCGALV